MFAKGYNINNSVEYILSNTTEENIAKYYFNIDKIPCRINIPYRRDNKPSLGVYYSTQGIAFVDFTTGEGGSLFDLIKKTYNLSFKDCLDRIVNDLPNIGYCKNKSIYTPTKIVKDRVKLSKGNDLKVKIRPFRDYDLKFWADFGISEKFLKFGDIYAISKIFIYKDNKEFVIPADKYAYVYVEFKDGIESLKVYQPFSQNYKWINNHDSSVWDLWNKLPQTGEKLIITSSRKDALCLWENINIPSTSLQAEGYIPKEHVINQLIDRFNMVFLLYDNDFDKVENHGKIFSDKLCGLFNIKPLMIPDEYKAKDPSDLYKKYGSIIFKNIINKIIYV